MTSMENYLKNRSMEEKSAEYRAIMKSIKELLPEFSPFGVNVGAAKFVPTPLKCRLDWIFTGWWMHKQVRIGKHGILPGDRSLYMCVRCGKVSTVYCWGGVDSGGCKREYWGYADPNVIREVSEC